MRIGFVHQPERGATDALLSAVAGRLLAEGVAVAGAVQANSACAPALHCDMDLSVLPDGPVIRISQSLGPASEGCRLDAGALEAAVVEVAARLMGARLLVINKFGKHEAEGRGFRDLIAEALAQDIPVLIGVNTPNRAAFAAFAGDLAEEVPSQPATVLGWCRAALTEGVAG